jgi:phosphate starvation-inducible PhoH-like protein
MSELNECKIDIPENVDLRYLLLPENQLIVLFEEQLNIRMVLRGHTVKFVGTPEATEAAQTVFDELLGLMSRSRQLSNKDIETALRVGRLSMRDGAPQIADAASNAIKSTNGLIKPRSKGQQSYLNSFAKNDVIFAIGPAGTGKTYLAVAKAVHFLKNGLVRKIVLTRPAVEAGESLGFLPGDFKEKVDPYLKPLYDALEDMLPQERLKRYLDQETIEILPLAFMRGRTLNNAFVILDEAQNATFTQLKMFLTRLGRNSKAVITGDITQIDLPSVKQSGLLSSVKLLKGIKGIHFSYLGKEDVVRHPLVKDIIEAYERFDQAEE